MVPSSRLLAWSALVALPMFLMAGMDSSGRALWSAGIGSFMLVAILDLVLSLNRLEGLSVECGNPQRLIQNQPGFLEFLISNPSHAKRNIRMGWAFPKDLETPFSERKVILPANSKKSKFSWAVTPTERGKIHLDRSYLETSSTLGFWDVRKSILASVEIRVYPNLSTERKSLATLFLNRGGFGIHAQRQVGKGRNFDELREYVHGDSYSDIDWKATARRNHPITKIFQIEKTQEIYVIIDASRLSGRLLESEGKTGSKIVKTNELERFLNASLVMRVAAEKQGDLFGQITFSDKVHGFLPAQTGRNHYNACRDMLYTLKPRRVTPDFDELFMNIRLKIRRRAMLFFLTNLDDPVLAENFTRNASLISGQHLVLVNMIQPKAARPLFGEVKAGEEIDLHERLGGHVFWHRLKELERNLKSRGVSFSLLRNERFSAELVTQYINLKQRQLL